MTLTDFTNRSFTQGALADRLSESVWQVQCCHCFAEIGTMDSEMLQRAIFLTAARGGVLCPDCRKKTCDICGLTRFDSDFFPYCLPHSDEVPSGQCCDVCLGQIGDLEPDVIELCPF